jgi:RNA polymerase sigma-70 factor (ECF subfamily)
MVNENNNSQVNEQELIAATQADSKAFGNLYKLYIGRVFKYVYSRLGNVPEAEDVTAQTFLAAFESFGKYRQDGHFASWLFTIARNKVVNYYRIPKKTAPLDSIEKSSIEIDPLQDMIRSDQLEVLANLVKALPEKDQELLRLRFLGEMSFSDIAKLIHRNEQAVKKAIYRLLARLKAQAEVSNE